jgi:hypothetical protein
MSVAEAKRRRLSELPSIPAFSNTIPGNKIPPQNATTVRYAKGID